MINRLIIRTKVFQTAYAYLCKGDKKITAGESELKVALSRVYDLYLFLLRLPVDITEYLEELINIRQKKHLASQEERNPNRKILHNRYIESLRASEKLNSFYKDFPLNWRQEETLLREIAHRIEESELYRNYLQEESSYEGDRTFWVNVFQSILTSNSSLATYLEDVSIHWDDSLLYIEKIECENKPSTDDEEIDKVVSEAKGTEAYSTIAYEAGTVEVVKSFVIKTMKRMLEGEDVDAVILPQFRDDEDMLFAQHLFRRTLLEFADITPLVAKHLTQSWDKERLADIDELLIHLAVTEFLHFPNVQTQVTINEYVELAKHFSTPKSSAFINGVLDAIAKDLKAERKILKD